MAAVHSRMPGDGVASINDAAGHALLAALDDAFCDVLQGRFGGGVIATLSRGGAPLDQKCLRPISTGHSRIELGLSLRDGTDAGHQGGSHCMAIGLVTLRQAPEQGSGDVHVLTEVFDEADMNEAADAGCLAAGVLLVGVPPGQAGQMPGGGLKVMRSGAAMGADAMVQQQQGRGWQALQPRGRVNRSGGLGSNGFRRAPSSSTVHPVSRLLLMRLGDRLAQVPQLGPALSQVVLGFEAATAGPV